MKPFTRRIAICLALVLLAGFVVARAAVQYGRGEGGFKLGVDLVGGTILVYEVDTEKLAQEQEANKDRKPFDPAEMAAFLKRRIDPADIYNVTIRPVGETRFEIILPTGGAYQAQKEEQAWQELLARVNEKPEWRDQLAGVDLNVTRGRDRDLIVRIWQELNKAALWPKLVEKYPDLKGKEAQFKAIRAGQTPQLIDALKKELPAANADELAKFVNANIAIVPESDVRTFVEANYSAGGKKNVTGEEVQRIKDLIAQQGSLEFRIVANRHMDGAAFKAAEDLIKKLDKAELDRLARAGLPPPAPHVDPEDSPFTYSWVELGQDERLTLMLSNRFKDETAPNSRWRQAAQAREKGVPFVLENDGVTDSNNQFRGSTTMLLYSRPTENVRLALEQRVEKQFDYFILLRNPLPDRRLTGDYLINAGVDDVSGRPQVAFTFNARGGQLFNELTSSNLPTGTPPNNNFSFLAIILDGYVVSAPSLSVPISTNGVIEMRSAKPEDLRRLAQILRSGALPATLKRQPVSENTIGPTLGADTIRRGTISIGVAFLLVMAFMVVYYRFAGLVACIALLANLLFTLAFMVFVNATFTLPGLAGLVLMLGMAVDTNVLIYERLREERDRGASLALALRNGYDRSFATVIDTHLSVMFTAIVLYTVGNDQLKGFGISLCAGLAISLFTSLYMTRLIFDIALSRGWLRNLNMFRFFSKPNIDFMKYRHFWFTTTVTLTVIGLALFLWRGPDGLNIDFVGGTTYSGQLDQPLRADELRRRLADDRQQERLAVKDVRQTDEDGMAFVVIYADGTAQPVQLANDPLPGGTKEDRQRAVALRASGLPDMTVEQTFVSTESHPGGGSRYFMVRSTEKEAELVQVAVNRLLVDDSGHSLLKQVALKDVKYEGNGATLTFSDPASPGYLKLLLDREFRAIGGGGAQSIELHGVGEGLEGRYTTVRLDLTGQQIKPDQFKAVVESAAKTFANRPLPERLENFDAQLAAETSRRALYAILASWVALLLYIWFRFGNWTFGLAAVLCLVHDVVLTLGVIAACHYIYQYVPWLADVLMIRDFKIDLPAVAALLTLVGYSINDKIVVYDRMREVRGKSVRLDAAMINASINQALSRTVLTGLSVFLVLFVLYVFGGEGVHLFAFVMIIGLAVGTYSSIYIASPLLLMFGEGQRSGAREREPVAATATA